MSDTLDDLDDDFLGPPLPPHPYPGLRPFTRAEWQIFFGRESMTQEIITRMLQRQFVAVHGDSGCGKSSLIAAGVMPFLEHDQARAGGKWSTCIMRPQDAPALNLARALAGEAGVEDFSRVLDIRRLINRGEGAPVAIANHLGCGAENNICILFDQFEELFEHDRRGGEDAPLLTAFLVGLLKDRPKGLHAILTMRSDYLGQCAHYRGFAEAVNETQYLVPRMERPALMRAIREPADLFGGGVDTELAARLISDAGMGQDQLPLIQHALMLMWRKRTTAGSPPPRLTIQDYSAGGGLASQLSQHADEVMAEAAKTPADNAVVEKVFRALTDRNSEGLAIRRRQSVAELVAITGADRERLQVLLKPFRAGDASFLRPFGDHPLADDDEVDISHEAFIRNWKRISEPGAGWLDQEADDGLIWTSLRIAAAAFDKDPEARLSNAVAIERDRWIGDHTEIWAARYGDQWQNVSNLISASVKAARAAALRRRVITFGAIAAAAVFAAVAVYAGWQTVQAQASQAEAENQRVNAQAAQAKAEAEQARAESAQAKAETAQALAEAAQRKTEEALNLAKKLQEDADIAAQKAKTQLASNLSFFGLLSAAQGATEDAVKLAVAAWPRAGDTATKQKVDTITNLARIFGSFRLRLKLQHEGAVNSARFSPDGALLLTGGGDGQVHLWNSVSGAEINRFVMGGVVNSVAFSDDRTSVAASSNGGKVNIWDLTGQKPVVELQECSGQATAVAFAPGNNLLAAGCTDGFVRIWDIAQHRLVQKLPGTNSAATPPTQNSSSSQQAQNAGPPAAVWGVAYARDGSRLATGADDGTVRVWTSLSGVPQHIELLGHTGPVWAASFSLDGTLLATGSKDNTARIWTVDGKLQAILSGHTDAITGVSFSPDGQRLATGSWDTTARVWAWSPPTETAAGVGRATVSLRGHTLGLVSVAYSPDGRLVTTSSDKTARVWDVQTPLPEVVFNQHKDQIWGLAYAPDGKTAASASNDGTVRFWDSATGEEKRQIPNQGSAIWSVSFAPDGRHFATGSYDHTAKIWDASNLQQIALLGAHTDAVTRVAYSPDGSQIATASWDKTVTFWSAATGERQFSLQSSASVISLAYSPDGSHIVVGSSDGTSNFWDLTTRAISLNLDTSVSTGSLAVGGAAMSPDGNTVATAFGWRVAVRSIRMNLGLFYLDGHGGDVNDVQFSHDGTRIATASSDGTARLWDAASGAELAMFEGSGAVMSRIAFSPDDTHVAVGSADNAVRVWNISKFGKGNLFDIACQRLGSNTDLSALIQQYSLPPVAPICGDTPPAAIDPDIWLQQPQQKS